MHRKGLFKTDFTVMTIKGDTKSAKSHTFILKYAFISEIRNMRSISLVGIYSGYESFGPVDTGDKEILLTYRYKRWMKT